MTDRLLEMQAKLEGATQAERQLEGLDRAAKKVEASANGAAGAETGLASAMAKRSEAAAKMIKGSEKAFAATDALASVVGKGTAALGLITLAIAGATAVYRAMVPEVDLLTSSLERQERQAREAGDAIKALQTTAGSVRFVDPDDVLALAKAQREFTETEAAAVDLARRQLDAEEQLIEARKRRAELLRSETKASSVKAAADIAFQTQIAKLGEDEKIWRQGLTVALARQADAEARLTRVREEARRKAAAPLATVPTDPGGGGPTKPKGTPKPKPTGPAGSSPQEILQASGDPGGLNLFSAYADGLEVVRRGLEAASASALDYIARQREISDAQEAATAGVLDYADAQGQAAAAAALAAALRGESVAEAVNAVLQGVTVEATVQAAFETAKGLAAAANPLTAATAAGHFAAAKAYAVTAGLAGLGALGSGGFGGGGAAPSSPATVQAPGPQGPGAFSERRGDGGGQVINVAMDLRSRPLASNRELADELVRVQNDYARQPGRRRLSVQTLGGRGGGF